MTSGPQQVEDGGKLKRLADGGHVLHGLGEELGMEIDDACLVERTVEGVEVTGKAHTVKGYHVGGSAHTGGGIIAMLGDLVAGAGDDEACRGRDVERILAVAASAHHVDIAFAVQRGLHAGLQYAVAEAQQLVDGHSAHLYGGKEGRNLLGGIGVAGDACQDVLGLFAAEPFLAEHTRQIIFHLHSLVFYSVGSKCQGYEKRPVVSYGRPFSYIYGISIRLSDSRLYQS